MKVSCLQENLAKGLSIAGRAVPTRSTLPILSNVKLETEEGRLKLSATDLEIGINCWIGAKVEEDGATTVPARLLTDFVNSLPPERIDMELAVRTQTLNLKCANFEANIKGIDAQEFPIIPETPEEHKIDLDPQELARMIKQTVFAAATDESRPVLSGVLVELGAGELTMAAADGYRLSASSAKLPGEVEEPMSILIPARALSELARVAGAGPQEEEPIALFVIPGRAQVLFHMTNVDLISQLIEGKFPDYKGIIPKPQPGAGPYTRTVVDTFRLLSAVKTANIFAREAANIVRLHTTPGGELSPGSVEIAATSAEIGDNVGELDAQVEGDEIETAFNAKYLIDVLSVIDAEKVALETTTPSSPGVFKPVGAEDFVHVIMPMHISR
ncbi:MAG: DNA polymerase III subunit beta [Chloroflexota bacterium]|nr:DNA polymerase III subunit beta [Chloroflexota bacterium]